MTKTNLDYYLLYMLDIQIKIAALNVVTNEKQWGSERWQMIEYWSRTVVNMSFSLFI